MLMLDEPSGGVAQKETEALGPLLLRVREHTGCSVLVIEHDMPLLSTICDRMVALELGGGHRRGHAGARCWSTPGWSRATSAPTRSAINRSGAAGTPKRPGSSARRHARAARWSRRGQRQRRAAAGPALRARLVVSSGRGPRQVRRRRRPGPGSAGPAPGPAATSPIRVICGDEGARWISRLASAAGGLAPDEQAGVEREAELVRAATGGR